MYEDVVKHYFAHEREVFGRTSVWVRGNKGGNSNGLTCTINFLLGLNACVCCDSLVNVGAMVSLRHCSERHAASALFFCNTFCV